MTKDRVTAFSDGVFAIVLTLLVIELAVPEIANGSSLTEYVTAMRPLVPKIVSFILTFVLITIHWVSHHYFFGHIRLVTIGLVWLNNLFLLWVCFMPFPTALLGDHPTDQFPILLYGVIQLLAALSFYLLRRYASKQELFLDREAAKDMGPSHSLPAIAIYALSLFLTFVNVYLALACFFIVPLLYFVPNLITTRGRDL